MKIVYQLTVTFLILAIFGIVSTTLRLVSFDGLVPFNRRVLTVISSKLILRFLGFRLVLPQKYTLPQQPTFITFNHNSLLDIFSLTALGLNVPFLLSEKTLKLIPLTLTAFGMGVIYVPQKKHPKRRARFFERLEERLHHEPLSFAGSSEGVHDYINGIAEFNSGVYRAALAGRLDISPLFVYIPKNYDNLDNYTSVSGGVMEVCTMEPVSIKNWTSENIEQKVVEMRLKFVEFYNIKHSTEII
jgi:putative phosphoserine phosphatase / 1-acylglycerol-3-phosphate O-acyltransferase